MERYRRLLLFLLALAVAVQVVFKSRSEVPSRTPAAFAVPGGGECLVSIAGDVRHPGVYPCSVNNMTHSVISMAEPLRPISAVLPAESATKPLQSGEALRVSIAADGTARITRSMMPAAQRLLLNIPLDLERVTRAELEQVPGIGPVLAGDIITWRQNNGGKMAAGDLPRVDGIGEMKYLSLRKYFQ